MICESRIVLQRPVRANTFPGLMSLYESNYHRLRWLIQEPEKFVGEQQSAVQGDCTLYLRLIERSRYTSTLHLSYFFQEDDLWIADPDLTIRIYHDAKMAEALACSRVHRHEILRQFRTGEGNEIERRWARNMLLSKMLEYCSDCGHRFVALDPDMRAIIKSPA